MYKDNITTKYKACIFDLDGTLVNTIADIAFAANYALEELGYPPCEEDSYRYKVGNGMRMICQRALPGEVRENEEVLQEMIRWYDTYYKAHCCDRSRAYPGIPELIRDLHQAGVKLAVISNKPHPQTLIVMETLFGYQDPDVSENGFRREGNNPPKGSSDAFFYVQGQCERFAKKPDPEALLDCIAKTGLPKEEIIYVGDSDVDVEFARRAGLDCIGCSWGFRGREELEQAGAAYIAEKAEDIFKYVTDRI